MSLKAQEEQLSGRTCLSISSCFRFCLPICYIRENKELRLPSRPPSCLSWLLTTFIKVLQLLMYSLLRFISALSFPPPPATNSLRLLRGKLSNHCCLMDLSAPGEDGRRHDGFFCRQFSQREGLHFAPRMSRIKAQ